MEYHEMGDIFVCKADRILRRVGTKHEKSKTGFISEKAVYRCESCEGCPFKQNCTKAKGDKIWQFHTASETCARKVWRTLQRNWESD